MECGERHVSSKNKFEDWVGELEGASKIVTDLCCWLGMTSFAQMQHELAIVIEDFILRPGPHGSKRSGLAPVRMTSFILCELRATWLGKIPVTVQSASQAKGYMTDERLKAAGWWVKGKPHSRDALRHAATYVARRRACEVLPGKAGQWPDVPKQHSRWPTTGPR